jgi:hypothetical protein
VDIGDRKVAEMRTRVTITQSALRRLPLPCFDKARDLYVCPAGELLRTTGTVSTDHAMRYIAPVPVCRACPLKPKCCPNMSARRIVRDINEDARSPVARPGADGRRMGNLNPWEIDGLHG